MRVLHTSDWHLGQRLVNCERTEEHQHFLRWLVQTICEQKVELLLIAGDVFDTGSPSNSALKLYYDFLQEICDTCCQQVIIIGGNHDSVATLNAPRELLRYFNVHVVGGATADPLEELIPIRDQEGNLRLVVCAVPFLRDRDVRLSVPGETAEEREARIKQGISDHYNQFVPHLQAYREQQVPVLAMGHLFAAGGSASDSEKDIHVGNLGQIGADQFPADFAYVALGHLHRPQLVNGRAHIRYAGSPIPLSFSEVADKKTVCLLDFADGRLERLQELEIPQCRRLVRFRGDLEKVKTQILLFENEGCSLPAWLEVQIELEEPLLNLTVQLEEALNHKPDLQMLILRPPLLLSVQKDLPDQVPATVDLHELKPQEVFQKKCESAFPNSDNAELLATFEELVELMGQQD